MPLTKDQARVFAESARAEGYSDDEIVSALSKEGFEEDIGFFKSKVAEPLASSANLLMNQPVGMLASGLKGVYELMANAPRALGLPGFQKPKTVEQIATEMQGVTNLPLFRKYEPESQFGQRASAAMHYPFEKLSEAIHEAGGEVARETDSPLLGSLVAGGLGVASGAIPVLGAKAAKGVKQRFSTKQKPPAPEEVPVLNEEANVLADMARQAEKVQSKAATIPYTGPKIERAQLQIKQRARMSPEEIEMFEYMSKQEQKRKALEYADEVTKERAFEELQLVPKENPATEPSPFAREPDYLFSPKTPRELEPLKYERPPPPEETTIQFFEELEAQRARQRQNEIEAAYVQRGSSELGRLGEENLAYQQLEQQRTRQRAAQEQAGSPLTDTLNRAAGEARQRQEFELMARREAAQGGLLQNKEAIEAVRQAKIEDLISNRSITSVGRPLTKATKTPKAPFGGPGRKQGGAVDPNVFKEGIKKLASTLSESEFVKLMQEKYGPEMARGAAAIYKQNQQDGLDSIKLGTIEQMQRHQFGKNAERLSYELEQRVRSGEDPLAVISQVEKQFETLGHQGERSWDKTIDLARDLGTSPARLLKMKPEKMRTDAQVVFAGMTKDNLAKVVLEKQQAIQEAGGIDGATPVQIADFVKSVYLFGGVVEKFTGLKTEAGRALNAIKILERDLETKTHIKQADFMRQLFETVGGRMKMERMLEIIEQSKTMTDAERARVIKELTRPTNLEIFRELYVHSKLSMRSLSPSLLGNLSVALSVIPERVLQAAVGSTRTAIDKALGRPFNPDRVHWAEVPALYSGSLRGALEGWVLAKDTWKNETPHLDPLTRIETPLIPAIKSSRLGVDPQSLKGKAIDAFGAGWRVWGRGLLTMDEFFQAVAFRGQLNALAVRDGLAKGLKGKKLEEHTQRLVNAGIENLPEGIYQNTLEFSREQTFKHKLPRIMGLDMEQIRQSLADSYLGVYIAPFFRTPINLLRYGGERTLLAPFAKGVRDEIKAGGSRADTQIGKLMMGAGLAGFITYLWDQELLNGGGPIDPGQRQAWLMENKPYSISLWKGGPQYQFSRLDPWAMPFAITADFLETIRYVKDSGMKADDFWDWMDTEAPKKTAMHIMHMITNSMINKVWMQTMAELLDAIRNPGMKAESAWHQIVSNVVPTWTRQIRREQDPILRETQNALDALKNSIPHLSETVKPMRDLWGKPIPIEKQFDGAQFISPTDIMFPKNDPVTEEIIKLQMSMKKPNDFLHPDEFSKLKMKWQEKDWLEEQSGQHIYQTLQQLMASPAWKDTPDFAKTKIIRDVVNEIRGAYKGMLLVQIQEKEPERMKKAIKEGRESTRRENGGWE